MTRLSRPGVGGGLSRGGINGREKTYGFLRSSPRRTTTAGGGGRSMGKSSLSSYTISGGSSSASSHSTNGSGGGGGAYGFTSNSSKHFHCHYVGFINNENYDDPGNGSEWS
jgi:hypothetical protein